MRGETLDEAIDRVAARLTAVPQDPTFAARLQLRMQRSVRLGFNLLAGSLASAAVIAGIGLMWGGRQGSLVEHSSFAPPLVAASASMAAHAPSVWASVVGGNASSALRAGASHGRESRASVPMIPPLSVPERLAVEALGAAALTTSDIDVAALDIPDLTLAPTDAPEEQQ